MKWLDKLERRFGRYAISGLMNYIIMLYGAGFVIDLVAPDLYTNYLCLNARAILSGQIWRIFTFIIAPPTTSLIFFLFALYLYYMIGRILEYQWGAFRFNLFYFSGMLLHVLAALGIYLFMGVNLSLSTFYLNLSMFFVYVSIFPDTQFLLFFIIPIKAKRLGIIEGIYYGGTILAGFFVPMFSSLWFSLYNVGILAYPANSVAALVSLLNFIIFFLGSRRRGRVARRTKGRKVYIKVVKNDENQVAHHRCSICGRTEKDAPDLEFRYCSKCVGGCEYCQDHLFTHEHRMQ